MAVDLRHLEYLANFAVCILKTGNIHGRKPEDVIVSLLIANTEGGLQSHLNLSIPPEPPESSPLAPSQPALAKQHLVWNCSKSQEAHGADAENRT